MILKTCTHPNCTLISSTDSPILAIYDKDAHGFYTNARCKTLAVASLGGEPTAKLAAGLQVSMTHDDAGDIVMIQRTK